MTGCSWSKYQLSNSHLESREMAQVDTLVTFINEGKADSALVQINEKSYLVDTGKKESVPAIKEILDVKGIESLDGIFLMHTHSDHIGGSKKLSQSYKMDKVYSAEISMDKENGGNKIDHLVSELGLNQEEFVAGDKVQITDTVAFKVL